MPKRPLHELPPLYAGDQGRRWKSSVSSFAKLDKVHISPNVLRVSIGKLSNQTRDCLASFLVLDGDMPQWILRIPKFPL